MTINRKNRHCTHNDDQWRIETTWNVCRGVLPQDIKTQNQYIKTEICFLNELIQSMCFAVETKGKKNTNLPPRKLFSVEERIKYLTKQKHHECKTYTKLNLITSTTECYVSCSQFNRKTNWDRLHGKPLKGSSANGNIKTTRKTLSF